MYRILLVDDEALIREGVSEIIAWRELGYELVASCQNGREALEYVQNHTVDVVLTDICMPFMDGMELSEKLSKEFPGIKIIILSGYDDFEYAQKAVKYRVEDYILKPVTATEMGEILTKVREKMKEERMQQKLLYQSRQLIEKEALWDAMTGNAVDFSQLEDIGVNVRASDYMVAIVQIDQYSTAFAAEEDKRESALMAFVAYNICSEILFAAGCGACVQGRDQRTWILFWTNKPREFREEAARLGRKLIDAIREAMGLEVTIGLGNYVRRLEDAYLSNETAGQAAEYRYVLGTNRVIDMDSIKPGVEVVKEEERLLDELSMVVKTGDLERIGTVIGSMVSYMQKKLFQKEFAWLFMQQMIERIAAQVKEEEEISGTERDKRIRSILGTKSVEEAMEFVRQYCIRATETVRNRKNAGGIRYAAKAVDYIEKNYGDSNLNLNTICSYLNISTSRFSSIFKNITGETFMETLIRIRMEKAKELLLTTDLKNYEIAERIGFSDPHYFSVSFKKITGKTPSQYAEKGQEE